MKLVLLNLILSTTFPIFFLAAVQCCQKIENEQFDIRKDCKVLMSAGEVGGYSICSIYYQRIFLRCRCQWPRDAVAAVGACVWGRCVRKPIEYSWFERMTLVIAAGLAETPQRFSLIIYTLLLPQCALETKHTQSAHDNNTVLPCVCASVQTVCRFQKPSVRNIKWHLDKHAQIKSSHCDVFGREVNWSWTGSKPWQPCKWSRWNVNGEGGGTQRDAEWQRLRRRIKGREAVRRMKRMRSNENAVKACGGIW